MKKSNQIHIDNLIKKIIIENLEEKADSLVSKIKKGRIPTDDEVEEKDTGPSAKAKRKAKAGAE